MLRKYICEYGLPISVPGANTVDDLKKYLEEDPHPTHRLVSCQFMDSGQYMLVWELKESVAEYIPTGTCGLV